MAKKGNGAKGTNSIFGKSKKQRQEELKEHLENTYGFDIYIAQYIEDDRLKIVDGIAINNQQEVVYGAYEHTDGKHYLLYFYRFTKIGKLANKKIIDSYQKYFLKTENMARKEYQRIIIGKDLTEDFILIANLVNNMTFEGYIEHTYVRKESFETRDEVVSFINEYIAYQKAESKHRKDVEKGVETEPFEEKDYNFDIQDFGSKFLDELMPDHLKVQSDEEEDSVPNVRIPTVTEEIIEEPK